MMNCRTKEPEATLLAQPDSIPGNWEIREGPLLPMAVLKTLLPPEKPLYGLYTWCGEYRIHRESIKQVGWKSIRIGGPMDDTTFAMIVEDDMEVMMTLGLRVHGQGKNRSNYTSDKTFIAGFLKGVDAFLTRYGPGGTFFKDNPGLPERPIKYVEVWNEPNFQYMIPDREPRAEVEAEREALYSKVLPAAYTYIKSKWPEVTVVGFGAGGSGSGDVRFIDHVHGNNNKVAASYDILSTHPYIAPCPPETWWKKDWPSGGYSTITNLSKIRSIMAEYRNGHKPIWYTEVGWPIAKADGGFFEEKRPGEQVTPILQAAYVVRQYLLSLRQAVERVHIMFATDTDGFNGGFFLRDKSWRPSAHAVRNLIRTLPHPRIVQEISDGKEGRYMYRMRPDVGNKEDAYVLAAWNVAGPDTVEVTMPGNKVRIVDMLGTLINIKCGKRRIQVPIGPCPVYIMGI